MKNFDSFIGIDWSGAKVRRHKGIQVAKAPRGGKDVSLIKPETAATWSRQAIADCLQREAQNGRILAGIDCNFGLVAHKVHELCGTETACAKDLWALVDEESFEAQDFYAGPFFEKRPDIFWSSGKQPAWFDLVGLRRLTEQGGPLGQPESPFKLIGPKQVGKGGLAGMRLLSYLKREMGEDVAVWPFDLPEALSRAKLVITEIYPRLYLSLAGHNVTKIETIAQLKPVLSHYESHLSGEIGTLNGDKSDALVSAAALRHFCRTERARESVFWGIPKAPAITREGWIFGFPLLKGRAD